MEKEALPWLPPAVELALMSDTPYVVDFDDAWFHRYDHSPSRIVRSLMAGKIDAIMRHAAVVVSAMNTWPIALGAVARGELKSSRA